MCVLITNLDDILGKDFDKNLPEDVKRKTEADVAHARQLQEKILEDIATNGDIDDFTGMTAVERVLNNDPDLIRTCSYVGGEGTYHPLQQQSYQGYTNTYTPYQMQTQPQNYSDYSYPAYNPYMNKEYMEVMNYCEDQYYNKMRGTYYGIMTPPQIGYTVPENIDANSYYNMIAYQNAMFINEASRQFSVWMNQILGNDSTNRPRTVISNPYNNQFWLNYLPCANEVQLDPYDYDTEEEYLEAWEDQRKRQCETHMLLFESMAHFKGIIGTEEYENQKLQMEDMYGYRPANEEKEYRQKRIAEVNEVIAAENAAMNDDDDNDNYIPQNTQGYDINGIRKEKITLKVGFRRDDGTYVPTSRKADPEKGYYEIIHTRQSDDLAERRYRSFWTPYLIDYKWYEGYCHVMAERAERMDKYNHYTLEQLFGPEDKMSEYWDELTKDDQKEAVHHIMKVLRGDRWQVKGGYASTFAHSGIDVNKINPSEGFISDYNLARDIYAYDKIYGANSSMDNQGLCNSMKSYYDLRRKMFIDKVMRNGKTDMSVGADLKPPGTYEMLPSLSEMNESDAKKYILTSGYISEPTSEFVNI